MTGKSSAVYKPGFCTMRLENIERLSSSSKLALLQSIADDFSAFFICISKHTASGTLGTMHTTPIDKVIKIINKAEGSYRRALERKLTRHERRAKQWRIMKRQMRKQFGKLARRSDAIHERWKERLGGIREELAHTRRELASTREQYELLKIKTENTMNHVEEKGDAV